MNSLVTKTSELHSHFVVMELFTTISKNWIRANNEGKNITTIHYDTIVKQISNYTQQAIMATSNVMNV
jgi:hypothetical protein